MTDSSQLDLFQADLSFVQIFKSLIQSGTLADIGPSALAVLVVIKTAVNYQTGRTSIPMREISKQTGLAVPTVQRAIRVLEEKALVEIERRGKTRKKNIYTVKEHLPFEDTRTEEPSGTLSFPYLPRKNAQIKSDIASFLKTGQVADGSPVQILFNIQTLNVHTGNGDINSVNLADQEPQPVLNLNQLPPEVRPMFAFLAAESIPSADND